MTKFNDAVRRFWDRIPCGTRNNSYPEGSKAFFDQIERERDAREPFIDDFARFSDRRERKVLEVGFGAGTDLVRFARAGANVSGIDLTEHALRLAQKRLALEGLSADLRQGDAEALPFSDGTFDFVYSWGVIHHTEDPSKAACEIVRVAKPGGEVCVMLYHRYSLVALQCWILNALLRCRPWRTFSEVIAHHIESHGTRAYSPQEARRMFSGLAEIRITRAVTLYDCRLGRSVYLPPWCRKLVPSRFGWFLVIQGFREPR